INKRDDADQLLNEYWLIVEAKPRLEEVLYHINQDPTQLTLFINKLVEFICSAITGNRNATKPCKAGIHAFTSVTPRTLTYAAVQARFAISPVKTWNVLDAKFNYETQIPDLKKTSKKHKRQASTDNLSNEESDDDGVVDMRNAMRAHMAQCPKQDKAMAIPSLLPPPTLFHRPLTIIRRKTRLNVGLSTNLGTNASVKNHAIRVGNSGVTIITIPSLILAHQTWIVMILLLLLVPVFVTYIAAGPAVNNHESSAIANHHFGIRTASKHIIATAVKIVIVSISVGLDC
ncbi:hypothetical protein C0991_005324, partial [Blastosporella zonata]